MRQMIAITFVLMFLLSAVSDDARQMLLSVGAGALVLGLILVMFSIDARAVMYLGIGAIVLAGLSEILAGAILVAAFVAIMCLVIFRLFGGDFARRHRRRRALL